MTKKTYDLFISWTGNYGRELSESIKRVFDQIVDSTSKQQISTFVSSIDIGAGKKWRNELDSALTNSSNALIIATQDVIHSDWVAHEAAILSGKVDHLWILLADSPAALLPTPLHDYQLGKLDRQSLSEIASELCENKQIKKPSPKLLNSLYKDFESVKDLYSNQYVTDDEKRWKSRLERALLINKQLQSPFDLYEIINVASSKLVLIAQNHWYMTNDEGKKQEEQFWPRIEKALKRGVDIDIVAMHPDIKPLKLASFKKPPADAISVWSHYMRGNEFPNHVKKTWESLTTDLVTCDRLST